MRDTNNNYLTTNLNLISSANNNRNNGTGQSTGMSNHHGSSNGVGGGSGNTNNSITCTAKVMWGTVGAISELREKEQADKKRMSSGGGRNNHKDQK